MALPTQPLSALVGRVLLLSPLTTQRFWQPLTDAVNQADRLAAGYPSLVCLDSRSVRLILRIFEHRGLDGGKHINGRKRQILTDVQGPILACRVHAANGHDGVEVL